MIQNFDAEGFTGGFECFSDVFLIIRIIPVLGKSVFPSQEVDGHPLDGGNIDKCVGAFGGCQVFIGEYLWVEALFTFQILFTKSLAVNLVLQSKWIRLAVFIHIS